MLCSLSAPALASHSPAKPIPQSVFAVPGDARHVAIATRFGGVYFTADGGVTFMNACHEALGADDVEAYPGAFTATGTLAVSTGFRGVSTTTEGCNWSQWAPDSFGLIKDVAPLGPGGLLALKTDSELPSLNEVWSSTDAGTTWTLAPAALPSDVTATSVYASPDGAQWFVGTRTSAGARLFRSDDSGQNWASFDFAGGDARSPRIVGMSPAPLTRLVAILSLDHADGVEPAAGDVVVLSEDAGATWVPLYQSAHAVLGAALDEDANLYFGNPEEGLFRFALADVGNPEPLHVSMTPTRGLAAAGGRIYSIGDETTDGYTVAVSSDAGTTFTPFFALCKNSITEACTNDSSVGTSCSSYGIETEPWQPLGPACTQKSAPTSTPVGGTGGNAGTGTPPGSDPNAPPTTQPGAPSAPGSSAGGAPTNAALPAPSSSGGNGHSLFKCSSGASAPAGSSTPLVALALSLIALRRRQGTEKGD
ncbi:MAG TPA: hypothetical protein VH062_13365 [Polyangiaceae bacterium]|nr:hypothetical protein [Polyangiaceae bacterium]